MEKTGRKMKLMGIWKTGFLNLELAESSKIPNLLLGAP